MTDKENQCPCPCFKEMNRKEKIEALIKSQSLQMDAYTREFEHLFNKRKYMGKVELIRKEIERLISTSWEEHSDITASGRAAALRELLSFIDSLQEEPVSSIWHDASELPDNPDTVVIEHSEYGTSVCLACKMSRVKGAVWCYLDDILPDNK